MLGTIVHIVTTALEQDSRVSPQERRPVPAVLPHHGMSFALPTNSITAPPPRVLPDIKSCGSTCVFTAAKSISFNITRQVRDVFAQLDARDTRITRSIEIKRGLPFRVTIKEVHA